MFAYFIHLHKNSCKVLIVQQMFDCTTIMLGNFCTDIEISTMLLYIMRKLRHFEMVKIGQNLHANMEGFRRAGHTYILSTARIAAYQSI